MYRLYSNGFILMTKAIFDSHSLTTSVLYTKLHCTALFRIYPPYNLQLLLIHSLTTLYYTTLHCTVLHSLYLLTGLFKVALSLLGSLQPRLLELEDFESIVMLMREWKRKGTFYTHLAIFTLLYCIVLYVLCIVYSNIAFFIV